MDAKKSDLQKTVDEIKKNTEEMDKFRKLYEERRKE